MSLGTRKTQWTAWILERQMLHTRVSCWTSLTITWRRSWNALSGLRVTPRSWYSWEWRNAEGMEPTEALLNSAKTNVKSCIWKAQSLTLLQAGNGPISGSSAEKVLGIIAGSKLSICQQSPPATARANCILSCTRRSYPGNQEKCHYKTSLTIFGQIHKIKMLIKMNEFCRGHQHDWKLDCLPCEGRLKDQSLFSLEKKVV